MPPINQSRNQISVKRDRPKVQCSPAGPLLKRLLAAAPVSLDSLSRVSSIPDQTVPRVPTQDGETPPEPTLHTVQEVAARLRVSTKTVRRRIKDGTIRTVPLGGRLVRISSDEMRRLTSGPALEP